METDRVLKLDGRSFFIHYASESTERIMESIYEKAGDIYFRGIFKDYELLPNVDYDVVFVGPIPHFFPHEQVLLILELIGWNPEEAQFLKLKTPAPTGTE